MVNYYFMREGEIVVQGRNLWDGEINDIPQWEFQMI